jgi:heterodisulfide reductase subunit C
MPSEPEQTISKLTSLMNRGSEEQTRAACTACDQCATECFLTESYPDINPQQLVDQVLSGKKQELIDSEFIWACTLYRSYSLE